MDRKKLIAGNWKMNTNHLEGIQMVQKLSYRLEREDYDRVDVVVCPPFTSLRSIQTVIAAEESRKAGKRIDLQSEFVSNLSDAIERGISELVDADMNEESTKLQALQVQQQLGIQALSIANSGSQNILSLFR